MSKLILSINAGSSSVKVSIFSSTAKQLAQIQISNLTAPPAKLSYSRGNDHSIKDQELPEVKSAQEAYDYILNHLISDSDLKELSSVDDIEFACHRIVHGGDFTKPTRIDKDTYRHLEELSDLAPLHNAGALDIVKAVYERSPKVTNVAFFDSAFHATIPEATRTYMIDPKRAEKNKLRKYGFHGLSYSFIFREACRYLGSYGPDTNLIALHLGSGCSVCCIEGGKSIDTSMGLTPLAGLPGATRSGDVDPSLIFHFTHDAGKPSASSSKELHITQAEQILNKESGWQSLTGTTDFATLTQKMKEGDASARLAFNILVDRICGYIGSYFLKLQGEVKALVFAGGIGEHSHELREAIMQRVKFLSFIPDYKASESPKEGVVADLGYERSEHRILLVRTDEQAEMARECVELADKLRG